jgi:Flp pilus assembly pilin Flp
MRKLLTIAWHRVEDERGQDLIEYALIGALIAVACTASMSALAGAMVAEFGVVSAGM